MARKKTDPTPPEVTPPEAYALNGAARFQTMTPQGELTIQKGERLPTALYDGLGAEAQKLFEPYAPEASGEAASSD